MAVLEYEKRGRIAYLTMNRPEVLNAQNREMYQALARAWADFVDDDNLWVAIVAGNGRAFSSGMDLKERAQMNAAGSVSDLSRERPLPTLGEGLEVWKPVIAAIHGYCLAGGWMLAQHCDFRIASEDAIFGITEVKRGLTPWWVVDLPRYIGLGNALEVVLMGEHISAQRAHEMGFVHRVVPPDQLMAEAERWANILVENAPLSVWALKEVLYRGLEMTRDEGLATAKHILYRVQQSEDNKEGPRAFAEKRKAVWKAR
ncbi:MAG: enoyl-CoA hydratase/isomerase family protein [Chloroflexi bacterium]|nr:enoyl-CoA hydratase/isomerase family protein [Chloroflexota bacterium]